MTWRLFFALLCIPGAAVPLSAFLPWLAQHGLAPGLFLSDMFANRIAAFFALDVLVSAVVLIAAAIHEKRRGALPHLWPVLVALFTIGVSLALPLLLALHRDVGRGGGEGGARDGEPRQSMRSSG